jgi:hypothetical protein
MVIVADLSGVVRHEKVVIFRVREMPVTRD